MNEASHTSPTHPNAEPQPTRRMDPEQGSATDFVAPPPPAAPPPGGPPPPGHQGGDFWSNASNGVKASLIIGALLVMGVFLWLLASLVGGGQPTPTPMPPLTTIPTLAPSTPVKGKPTLTTTRTTYIYAGPGTDYPQIGLLQEGLSADIIGVNAQKDWWAIKFPQASNGIGWVANDAVSVTHATDVPTLQSPILPTPTTAPPVAVTDWKGEYFTNPDLQGDPALIRNDRDINFNWGGQPPAEGLPGEHWSARWTINREIAAGTYTMDVWADDGVRIFVDNQLIINGWESGGARHYTASVNVTRGAHEVRVEYFQSSGDSLIQVRFGFDGDAYPDWKAEYFNNPDVANSPIVVRNDPSIDFDWGLGAPVSGLPQDNYSVRWGRRVQFDKGDYLFSVEVEGGVRLWLDDRLLIDDWVNGPYRTLHAQSGVIPAGAHDLRIEFFKTTGRGLIRVSWQSMAGEPPTAIIDLPAAIVAGQPVQFSAQRSSAAPGRQIVTFEWDFGNGLGSNDINPIIVFPEPGEYVITLKVFDDLMQMGESRVRVSVAPAEVKPPLAIIAGPMTGQVGELLTFHGRDSQGSAPIVRYEWDFGDGQTAVGAEVGHIYQQPGAYTIFLTVTDEQGQQGRTGMQVTITAAPTPIPSPEPTTTPAPEPTVTPVPTEGPTPTPPGHDITQILWQLTSIASGKQAPVPALPDAPITLLLGPDGAYSGNGGCNSYEGVYEIMAPGQIRFDLMTQSQILCDQPIMEQETAFFDLLLKVDAYVSEDMKLRLMTNDQWTLFFEKAHE